MKDKQCAICGGKVVPKKVALDRMLHGKLFLFEKVPIRSCVRCGEIWVPGKVLEWMEHALERKLKPTRKVSVPVYAA